MNRILISVVMLTASMTTFAAEAPDANRQVAEALKEVGTTQYEIDSASAPIKSMADLKEHLRTNSRSPLLRLRPEARAAFLKSMMFTNYGLASYSFVPLESLSVSEAYAVLSLFGEQRAVGMIPGMRASNSVEESMLLMSQVGRYSPLGEDDPPLTPTYPVPHTGCIVDSTNNPPTIGCEPHPNTTCAPARCKW
jgi:hypothetical protein